MKPLDPFGDSVHAWMIHTCTHIHTRAHSDIVPSCWVKSPQGTNKQMITSGDGWSHLTAESPAFIGFCVGHICNVTYYFCPTKWICPKLWPSGFMLTMRDHVVFLGMTITPSEVPNKQFSLCFNSCPPPNWHTIHLKGTQINLGEYRGYLFIQGPAMQRGWQGR